MKRVRTALIAALGLFVGLTTIHSAQPIVCAEEPPEPKQAVYVKIILPTATRPGAPVVEEWIAKRLQRRGSKWRAVTDWVPLAERGEKWTHVWRAMLDGKGWGCPVVGCVEERNADGKIKVELLGWTPAGARIRGRTLKAEIGNRRVAAVDIGDGKNIAYVALLVGPAPSKESPK